ncbi:tyrosine-protein kinase transmembrane receptor Ror-like isoform X2 [Brevipalpus obovatus]|uniref:tyrosine-protein kinase transmembrane receptor Ror-like isoform X2 n=1 Tax=Brevipalpus obovatus TaxID=246614 RepID=UPI003D9DECB0
MLISNSNNRCWMKVFSPPSLSSKSILIYYYCFNTALILLLRNCEHILAKSTKFSSPEIFNPYHGQSLSESLSSWNLSSRSNFMETFNDGNKLNSLPPPSSSIIQSTASTSSSSVPSGSLSISHHKSPGQSSSKNFTQNSFDLDTNNLDSIEGGENNNNNNSSKSIVLKKGLSNVTRTTGDNVTLRCDFITTIGDKMIKIDWFKNMVPIESDGEKITIKTTFKKMPSTQKSDHKLISSRLRIIKVNVFDSGFFRCEASGPSDSVESEAVLKIEAGEEPVTYSSISADTLHVQPSFMGFNSASQPSINPNINSQPPATSVSGSDFDADPTSSSIGGSCEPYRGSACSQYLGNGSIFVRSPGSQAIIERKISEVFSVIKTSKDVSPQCHRFAIPSLCYYSFPLCDAHSETIRPRTVCRDECEMLQTEICHQEYTLGKRHSTITQANILPTCGDLPAIGSHEGHQCIRLGVPNAIHVTPDHTCYNDDGEGYRGTVSRSKSGDECVPWNHQVFHKTADYPELIGGHNYCRNPGGILSQPWCFVQNSKIERAFCDIPKCLDTLWVYLIIPIAGASTLFILVGMIILIKTRIRSKPVAASSYNGRTGVSPGTLGLSPRKGNTSGGSNSMEMNPLLPRKQAKATEYPMCNIRFISELGEGAFGKVWRGELMMSVGSAVVPIAAKTLKVDANYKTKQDFVREAELMAELQHPNIVCLVGVCFKEDPMCMLFEYMSQGDLKEYLTQHSPQAELAMTRDGQRPKVLDINDFLHIATQIGAGMEYLSDHHYVHRDLAARNCLVSDHLTVKISDFGLSRDIYASDYYRVQSRSPLPVRWMPPESILYGKYTTESDVWSMGVLLWEIFSYGAQPYYSYSNQEVIDMIRNLQLLPCPTECPHNIYNLMLQCWNEIPSKRPTFSQLHQRLRNWKAVYSNTMASSLANASSSHSSSLTMNPHLSSTNHLQQAQYSSKTLSHPNHHHSHYNTYHQQPQQSQNSQSQIQFPMPPQYHHHTTHHHTPTHTSYTNTQPSYSSGTIPSTMGPHNFNNMNHTHIQQHFDGSSIYGVPFTYDSGKIRQTQVT